MAEYVMGRDDDQAEVSRSLLEHAGPERAAQIEWRPRPNVPGGGVFVMPDDLADGYTSDRLSRLDDNERGDRIEEATDGRTAEMTDPTEHNDAIARGEAVAQASPATGPNPLVQTSTEGDVTAENQTTTRRPSRAEARRAAKADSNKE